MTDAASVLAWAASRPAPAVATPGAPVRVVVEDEAERIRDLPWADYSDAEVRAAAVAWATARWAKPGAKMQFRDIQALALLVGHLTDGAFLPIGTGWGKCTHGDTTIYLPNDGVRTTMRQLAEHTDGQPFLVSSLTPEGSVAPRTAVAFKSGEKPCVKVSLMGGQTVTLSTDHPVLTGRGYVNAAELLDTDLVATPRQYPAPLTRGPDISDDEVKLYAYFAANGGCTKNHADFCDDNKGMVGEFIDLVRAAGGEVAEADTQGRNATYLRTVGMRPFIRRWGLDVLSKHKRLPATFYGLPDEKVALLLNRFISSDGHIGYSTRAIELTLASEGLIDDMWFLLLRLGIRARKTFKRAKCQTGTFDAWRLVVTGADNIERFFKKVGLLYGQEERSLGLLALVRDVVGNTNVDVVPIGRPEAREIADELGAGRRSEIRTAIKARSTEGSYVGRDTFAAFCDTYGYRGKHAWLAHSDLLWEKVHSVTPVGVHPVYDLSVPDTENFVADGVVVHNSLISLLAADALGARRPLLLIPPAMRVPLDNARTRDYAPSFRLPSNLKIMAYSQLSQATSTDVLERLAPDVIVADECFPYETLVRTDVGSVPIGDIVERGVGTFALSMNTRTGEWQWRRIVRRLRNNPAKKLVRVEHAQGKLLCTSTHKVWTENRGYVKAVHLHDGDRLRWVREDGNGAQTRREHAALLHPRMLDIAPDAAARSNRCVACVRSVRGEPGTAVASCAQAPRTESVRCVRSRVPAQVDGEAQRVGGLLLTEVCAGEGGPRVSQGAAREPGAVARGAHAAEQPDGEPRHACKDAGVVDRANLPGTRREREDDRTPAALGGGSRPADGVRHRDSVGEGRVRVVASLLQGGHCRPGEDARHRGGREDAQDAEVAAHRRAEGVCSTGSRVERVAVLESGSPDGHREGVGGHSHLYDLEVEETHNYVADGVLVSNCHNLRHVDSARTKRLIRYLRAHPNTRVVLMSGTLTSKSVRDYAHLAEWALKKNSPVPRTSFFPVLTAFCSILDARSVKTDAEGNHFAAEPAPHDWSMFSALYPEWQEEEDIAVRTARARERYMERLLSSPGVVGTDSLSVGASLYFCERKLEAPPTVIAALGDLADRWQRPDGEELVLALDVWRCGRQLSQGFYYRWKWPHAENKPDEDDKDWLRTRAQWHREVRDICKRNLPHLDSPLLVTMAARRALEGQESPLAKEPLLLHALEEWQPHAKRRWHGKPTPPTETVWLDRFLIDDALAWLKEHPTGLLWYADKAMAEGLAERGVKVFGAGTNPEEIQGAYGAALSLHVHKDGKNLQKHTENLFLDFLPSGSPMEQALSRTHRAGQEADEVYAYFYGHTEPARAAIASARNDARYIQDTMNTPQRLCYGTWTQE